VKLEWSLFAIEDRNKIFDYIEQDDPRAAIFVDERIEEQTKILDRFPKCGRQGRVEGTRDGDHPYTLYCHLPGFG
jgi:toxin ParE1/3/4